MAALEDVGKAASFVLKDHLVWIIPAGLTIMIAIIGGWYKMVLPWLWPAQLTSRGHLHASWREPYPYLQTRYEGNWILFSVQTEVHPRANESVREFYLEIQPPNGEDSIKSAAQSGDENRLAQGTLLRKNEVVGPYLAHFELGEEQLGIVGLEQARNKLKKCKFNLVLKVRFRDRWPICKLILLDDKSAQRS